ncbi:hypothetical protein ACHWQZ_G007761 [Mnemiopsis leidyi]
MKSNFFEFFLLIAGLAESVRFQQWERLEGKLKHVTVGASGIWGINSGGALYRRGDGNSWQVVPGGLQQIEASKERNVWGAAQKHIWRYNGITWERADGWLQQVTSGRSGVWGVSHSTVWYRPYTYGDEATIGETWEQVSAYPLMKWVASGVDLVLAIDRSGNLYYRNGINVSQPTGTSWVKVEGVPLLKQVDVYNSVVMAVDTEDNIWSNVIEY